MPGTPPSSPPSPPAARPRFVLASASPARLRLLRAAGLDPEVIVSGVPEDDVAGLPAAEAVAVLAERKAVSVAERLRRGIGAEAGSGAASAGGGAGPAGVPGGDASGVAGRGVAGGGGVRRAGGGVAGGGGVRRAGGGDAGGGGARRTRGGSAGGGGGDEGGGAGVLVLGCDSLLELDGVAQGKPVDAAEAIRRWQRMRGRSGVLHTGHCLVSGGRREGGVVSTVVRFADPTDAELTAYVATGEPLAVAGAFTLDGRGAPFVVGIDGDPGAVIGVSLPLVRVLLARFGLAITALWS